MVDSVIIDSIVSNVIMVLLEMIKGLIIWEWKNLLHRWTSLKKSVLKYVKGQENLKDGNKIKN
jgi:large-conductance mechanosensitive channel